MYTVYIYVIIWFSWFFIEWKKKAMDKRFLMIKQLLGGWTGGLQCDFPCFCLHHGAMDLDGLGIWYIPNNYGATKLHHVYHRLLGNDGWISIDIMMHLWLDMFTHPTRKINLYHEAKKNEVAKSVPHVEMLLGLVKPLGPWFWHDLTAKNEINKKRHGNLMMSGDSID